MKRFKKTIRKAWATNKMLGFGGFILEVIRYLLKLDSSVQNSRINPTEVVYNKKLSTLRKIPREVKYNLNFDDLVPHYSDITLLERLVEIFPKIKITIFMSANSRVGRDCNILNNPEFCQRIAQLPKNNFEIGFHGYYHHLNDWARTPEFKYLSKKEATDILRKCERVFKKAGIEFIRGFRPPRFELSKGTQEALEDLNYLFLSDLPKYYEEHKDIKIPRVFANSDIVENEEYIFYKQYRHLLLDTRKYYIHRGHLVGNCDNYLTQESFNNIIKTINNFKKVKFMFLSEIADEIRRRQP